jgi:hypothetical protein
MIMCNHRLEDRKIRELEISERESLRNYQQSEWDEEMAKVGFILLSNDDHIILLILIKTHKLF